MNNILKEYKYNILILILSLTFFFINNFSIRAEEICKPPIFEQKEQKEQNNDDDENWKKFDGYLIGNIIINSKKQFNTNKEKNKLYRNIYNTLEYLTPNLNSDIILNKIPFKEKDRLDIQKLKYCKKELESISYIDDIKIELEENPVDITYIDIKISFKNKFPIMVDPIAMYICNSNFLGTGHQLSLRAVPGNGILLDGYEIKYLVPDIKNKDINFLLINNKFTNSNLIKLKLDRNFTRPVRFGGNISNATGYSNINTIGQSEEEYSYKFNHFDLWCGKTIDIWTENYNEFYKRLIITSGLNSYRYLDKPENLKINNIPILYDQRSIGFGIYYMNKKVIKIKDSYGKNNNDKIHEGIKIYLYGGFISSSQLYFALDFAKAKLFETLGYFYINSKFLKLTNGYFDNTNDKKEIIDSSFSVETNFGYISPKKKIGTDMRQIITLNYLGIFSKNITNFTSIDGYHYMEYYPNTYSTLKQRVQACAETIVYLPFKVFWINIDPFFFIETLYTESINNKEVKEYENIIKNDFCFGGGMLLSFFGFNLKLGLGYSPTILEEKLRLNIILGRSFELDRANINVTSPNYRPPS
ncbi:MAG: hypothetical protein GY830_06150 [Bacteroidetes bacterium]|nr:hypothetical protein [Bacteroidota bacterium]